MAQRDAAMGERRPWLGRSAWAGAVLLLILAGWLIVTGYKRMAPVQSHYLVENTRDALATCQQHIGRLSGDGQAPPAVNNDGTHPEFYFVWPKGSFHNIGADGVSNTASATCRGDLSTGRVRVLSLNGDIVTLAH